MHFNWTAYPFTTPPELRGEASACQVAVIGAGPVGLSAALNLARRGVRVVLLEARDQLSDGSRAISLDRQSMRTLDRLGVGREFQARAIPREENLVYYRDRLVYAMQHERPEGEKHFELNILQQCWMEQLLLNGVLAQPEADVRWLSHVTGLAQSDNGVSITVESPEGEYVLNADYAIAADGGRGISRSLLDMRYESVTTENISERAFVICDFEMETSLSKARRFYLNPPSRPGSTVLLHAQPFNTWRLDYPLGDDEDQCDALKPETIEARLAEHLDWIGETGERRVLWSSIYRPRAVTLPAYRKGRCFFAGDAAHLSPIFGGRGLNLGLADANNLAWKLGLVVNRAADPVLLDSYDFERRQMARKTLSDLSQAAVFMARPSKGVTFMCDAVLDLVAEVPFARDLFDAHRAPKREGYSQTGDMDDDPPTGPVPGNPVPNPVVTGPSGGPAHLYDILPEGVAALHIADENGLTAEEEQMLAQLEATTPLQRFVVNCPHAGDEEKMRVASHIGKGTTLLLRPDGYIAARFERGELGGLERSIADLLAGRACQPEDGVQQ